MKLTISKSKNAESFYISKSYRNNNGKSTTINIRKLGTLKELQEQLGTDRDGVVAWAKEQVRIETEKYKAEQQQKEVQITFHADRLMDYNIQRFYQGGYLFLQSIYYQLGLNKICRKIKAKYTYEYDLNAILSDLIYTRILEPDSKRSSYQFAQKFLEPPEYELHDVYRALSVLAEQCDLIQSEVYKNSHFLGKRNDRIMYYDCTNYYFEIEQEDGIKRYGKSKEHRPNPIVQMGLFMDGDGIPVAFSLFPGNQNEQKSLKPLETKVIRDLGCKKFVYCSDAGLGSEDNRFFNHIGERSFIVTQSIKKLPEEEREWALNGNGFRRVRDNIEVDITKLGDDDMNDLFYKEIPYTTKQLDQRLIITYSPKYAAYQKKIREKQIERAESMIKSGNTKKSKNPNDPARFIKKTSVTKEGEIAEYQSNELNMDKILEETKYDGLYAVCTDLLEDFVGDILKVSEGRWQIEACFRIMKTDFSARPVHVRREDRIKAHFLICFLALMVFRFLEKKLENKYTSDTILDTLRLMNFTDIEEQGFIPIYTRSQLTDDLHIACGFRTDYQFISKSKMKEIQKSSKNK
ncbi:MAG: IS1634 family transposase [Lachnospiraceae bacterium]|nr:IS1634 family transposase [Lachnospiraceae bacterium]MEE3451628.1 IS1634 family transposase [Acutalibacteraceae bacterium]